MYWHIFPTYGEAKDSVWRDPGMLFNIIPKELVAQVNQTDLVVQFKNGSLYQLKGSDQPDSLRGPNPFGVIFDEFDTQKQEGWGVIEPILRANGGWAWFVGTPQGKQKLFEMYHRGLEGHKEWKSWLLKASQSGIISLDQLDEAKKSMSQALYNQEFECEFLEGAGSVFRNVRECMTAQPHDPNTPEHKDDIYVIGCDLAKVKDWTVVRVYSRTTNSLVFSDRFQTIEWPFQKKRIQMISKHFRNALVMLDATGIGDPICDDLLRANVPVEPIKITEPLKKELVEKLSIWIEQKKVHLLKDETALFEYENFSYNIGPTGKIRYGAKEGFHDDIVMADALAVWSLQPIYQEGVIKEPTHAQYMLMRAKKQYEENASYLENQSDWTEWESTTDDLTF